MPEQAELCVQPGRGGLAAGRQSAPRAPTDFEGDPARAWDHLREVLKAQPNAQIITDQDAYLHAEFSSRWLGFVDDVEFLLDQSADRIHVRSASRLGYSDFGVNRARVEALREAFDDLQQR